MTTPVHAWHSTEDLFHVLIWPSSPRAKKWRFRAECYVGHVATRPVSAKRFETLAEAEDWAISFLVDRANYALKEMADKLSHIGLTRPR